MARRKTRRAPKSAITGRFVGKRYARKHPKTTFWQRIPIGRRKRKK